MIRIGSSLNRRRASARSSAVVIFRFFAVRLDDVDDVAGALGERGLVGRFDAGLAQRDGVAQHVDAESPAASARGKSIRAESSRRSPRRPASRLTRFTVSLTGCAAIAAPCSAAASMVRLIRSSVTNGRAASCTSTISVPRIDGLEGVRHRVLPPRPAGHDAEAPAVARRRSAARPRAPAAAPRSRRSRPDGCRTRRRCAAGSTAPPTSSSCFGTPAPSRRPAPPAAMMAVTCMCRRRPIPRVGQTSIIASPPAHPTSRRPARRRRCARRRARGSRTR